MFFSLCFYIKKIQIINNLNVYIITRIGLKQSKKIIHLFVTMCTIIFLLVLYTFLLGIYGCQNTTIQLIGLLFIHTIFYVVEANFIFLQFHRKSNVVYVVIPIILNFIYQYVFFVYE